ncbi:RNA 3'-terminal phosphate cyclase [Candidatus Woesearchaeota archaeon]|nr:RNA 3'-terminal phosphate cyclase [Candidatus Woesearchaeota archaeon]
MITLDGSYGEGGGALVRTALALSALTGKAFTLKNIRAGREHPGLKAQHLTAIKALKEMCGAATNDITIGSTELDFTPGKFKSGTFNLDIGTAGSISLLLQALILPSLFASNKITLHLKGGTCGLGQASVDYLQNVFLPQIQPFVEKLELKIWKRGYYPAGGGEVSLEISPRFKLNKFSSYAAFIAELGLKIQRIILVEQGKLEQIRGRINLSAELQSKEVAERVKIAAEKSLSSLGVPVNIQIEYSVTASMGGEVVLWGIFSQAGKVNFDHPVILGSDALLEKNKPSEQIGREAAEKLIFEISSGYPLDKHLVDQLLVFMALLPGSQIKCSEISEHARTNIYVIENFLPISFSVENHKITAFAKDL